MSDKSIATYVPLHISNPWLAWLFLAISTVGFVGFLPGKLTGKIGKGGGTAGTIVTALAMWLCANITDGVGWTVIFVILSTIGYTAVGPAEALMASWGARQRHTGEMVTHDFNETCVDELSGMMAAALPLMIHTPYNSWQFSVGMLLAFGLFRWFDAKKVGPVAWFETNLDGPFGVMADDMVAGVMAGVIVLPIVAMLSY